MKLTINQKRKLAVALPAALLLAMTGIYAAPAQTSDDAAATYKTKCVACHGPNAEKKFDATKADEQLSEAILKGIKVDKPPNMPAYEAKGINADQAKALVSYMKSLKH